VAEDGVLEGGQPRRVDVLDHFHQHHGVVPGKPVVPVGHRRLEQPDPLALPVGEGVESQPSLGGLEGARGDVDADDLGERVVREQCPEQRSLAAAEVDHASDLLVAQRREDRLVTDGHQGAGVTVGVVFGVVARGRRLVDRLVDRPVVELGEPRSGGVDEATLPDQRAPQDGLALRVRGQPLAAGAEQLVDLFVGDPVVLAAVEDWQQHIQV